MTEPKQKDPARQRRGRGARRKGGMFELEVVKNHTEIVGVFAEKVPLSGALPGHKGDVKVDVLGGLRGECKARKGGAGFKVLEGWMEDNDLLFLKRDGQPPLICMTWDVYGNLVAEASASWKVDVLIGLAPERKVMDYKTYAKIQELIHERSGARSASESESK